ncbi:MAG: aldehyde ferredoxin oxidoreductase family protein [Phycisphaerales bacterium]|nr:MAG: aldehyde ferredoxin oxidoreductase family protein [Phycisphaerales bacterium]
MTLYQGTSLRVDLNSGQIAKATTPKNGIGGRSFNSVTLLEELTPGVDPLGPDNILCISVGPLTGTALPATCRFIASARSPLTGYLGDSGARGFFAPELRWSGHDQIVFTGVSDGWVYLFIDDDNVEIRDASHLVGMDITQTTIQLRKELENPDLQVAAIGPAGENLVRYAIISCNLTRAAGRTGMGAVMGSKRVKAIAVRGCKPVKPVDGDRFKKACSQLRASIEDHPEFEARKKYGTTRIMDSLARMGVLPAYHYRSACFEHLHQVNGEALRKNHVVKEKSCYNCSIHCSRYNFTQYSEGEGPEYEAQAGFTVKCGNSDLELGVAASNAVNRLGLDCISTAEILAWLMECRHEGVITDADVDGIDLSWGSREALIRLPEMIARREGVGDILADGARRASKSFGAAAEELTVHVKGLELFSADPRGIKGYGLMNAVNSRGGDHYRGEPMIELTDDEALAIKRVGDPDAAHRLKEKGKGALVNYSEHLGILSDSMTICKNISCCMDVVDFELAADAYSGLLGRDISASQLWEACTEISQVERDFNVREGLRPEEDSLPRRFTDHPIPDGPAKGTRIDLNRMVKDYYKQKGWRI